MPAGADQRRLARVAAGSLDTAGTAVAAAPPRRSRPAARLKSAAVRSRFVQLDRLEGAEADAAQLRREGRGVADEHDRQPVGLQIGPRDALDVVDGDGVDALTEVWSSSTGSPKKRTLSTCVAIASGVSIVSGKLPVM